MELLARCRAASGDSLVSFELLPRAGHRSRASATLPASPIRCAEQARLLCADRADRRGRRQRSSRAHSETALARGAGGRPDRRRHHRRERRAGAASCGSCARASSSCRNTPASASSMTSPCPSRACPRSSPGPSRSATKMLPGMRRIAFGHVGDGNVHFNVYQPEAMDGAEFLRARAKRSAPPSTIWPWNWMAASAPSTASASCAGRRCAATNPTIELDLMRRIKQALDPLDLMNPGKGRCDHDLHRTCPRHALHARCRRRHRRSDRGCPATAR